MRKKLLIKELNKVCLGEELFLNVENLKKYFDKAKDLLI